MSGGPRRVVDTVVIGGGQAGLAAGFHLQRLGIDHVILDEHRTVGDAWRNRWDSLQLFTPRRYSGLPGLAFAGPPWAMPGKDEVADYLEEYAERFTLPVRSGVLVERLRRTGGSYAVGTSDGSISARNVIVATGPFHHPDVPDFADQLDPDILQLLSSDYRRPHQLRDGAVLVVGAGSSGAEIALELSRGHDVLISGPDPGREPVAPGSRLHRLVTPLMWFMASRVVDVANPLGRRVRDRFLRPPRGIPRGRVSRRDLLAAGIEWVERVDGTTAGRPRLTDGTVVDVANVVWCTGFRPNFGWVEIPVFDEYGSPIHERGVIGTAPGLYFLGLLFQRSLSSALIGGVGRDAEFVTRHIAEHRQARASTSSGAADLVSR